MTRLQVNEGVVKTAGFNMQTEKHLEALKETDKTLKVALDDPEGLLGHQRRIVFMVSVGAQQLIEVYFHRLNIIKP